VNGVPSLKHIKLTGCRNLVTIHESVGFLGKLESLDARGCCSSGISLSLLLPFTLRIVKLVDSLMHVGEGQKIVPWHYQLFQVRKTAKNKLEICISQTTIYT